ncbi:MAG: DUF7379 domain-containing protein [Bacteroidota bacterium]
MKTTSSNQFPEFHFNVLGHEINQAELQRKIRRESSQQPQSFWGTLGWSDNSAFHYKGSIAFSEKGNQRSEGPTGKIVDELKLFNPLINSATPLVERFINFDECSLDQFKLFKKSRKQLQLTLFLQPDEGALVYIQHSLKDNFRDKDADIEFIQPQKTNADFGSDRDRLNYIFDFIPKNKVDFSLVDNELHLEQGEEENDSSFILKILTFKREPGTALDLFKKSMARINKATLYETIEGGFAEKVGEDKYGLFLFNPAINETDNEGLKRGGRFEALSGMEGVDPAKKTLLLIHGTFSTTLNTFAHLHYLKNGQPSLLQELIANGTYEQILGFDHPTISHNADQNIMHLLENYFDSFSFGENHVDAIACSRGCIVAEALSSHPDAAAKIKLGKIMLFSAANGVGYFEKGAYIPKFLSIWRKTASGPFLKVILTLAQYSSEFFLQMPGCEQMTPGHQSLETILNRQPNSPSCLFLCMVSDWNFDIARGTLFKRSGAWLMDRSIALFLGKEHDWVVGCVSQRKLPLNAQRRTDINLDSMHCRYFDEAYTKSDILVNLHIKNFLSEV